MGYRIYKRHEKNKWDEWDVRKRWDLKDDGDKIADILDEVCEIW